nr:protein-arginine deiminase type-1 isoform X2 [Manis javanica]
MAPQRAVQLSLKKPTYAVCMVGVETYVDVHSDLPQGAETFRVSGSSGLEVFVVYDPARVTAPTDKTHWPLDANVDVTVSVDTASKDLNDLKVQVSYFGQHQGGALGHSVLYLTGVDISLDVDTHRTGKVRRAQGDKKTWHWGPEGHGAILLVNCDRDSFRLRGQDLANSQPASLKDLQDMSPMVLTCDGPDELFNSHKLVLNVPFSDSQRVRVFHARALSAADKQRVHEHTTYYPRRGFKHCPTLQMKVGIPSRTTGGCWDPSICPMKSSGGRGSRRSASTWRGSPSLTLISWGWSPSASAWWTPGVMDSQDSNEKFLYVMNELAWKANCKLIICPWTENRNDRWIQDEIEFGYIEAPHKSFPVVLDSPRNRGLKDFPYDKILGPDFGYVTREIPFAGASSFDSFGNLDVSPPVTVGSKEYPLGRILIGGSFPKSYGRHMSKVVRDFLQAQQVQAPVELYSDWLSVGHVDEFLSFVPTSDQKGFRLLLASPSACLKLFQEKKEEGYGEAAQFDGLKHQVKRSINEMLVDRGLRNDSLYVQSCIDWNREVLKQELGLTEQDIVDVPQLFSLKGSYAEAFFPDMVNMVVLGKHLGIPKPFGPIINGRCCLEEKVRSLLEPLGLHCVFIDDYLFYHQLLGEIHCGTNVRRRPFSFKWWHMVP